MQTLQHSYRGLSLVIELNIDRILSLLAIVAALFAAGYLAGL